MEPGGSRDGLVDQQGAEGRRGDSLSPGSHPHPLSLESLAPGSSHSPAGVFLPGENWPVCGFYGPETAFSLQALSAEPRLPRPPPRPPALLLSSTAFSLKSGLRRLRGRNESDEQGSG